MILDIEQTSGKLNISYFKDGKTKIKEFPVETKNWKPCSPKDKNRSTDIKNWDGGCVKAIASKNLNKFSVYDFIRNLSDEDKEELLSFDKPDIYMVDIETEVTEGFPEPEIAANKVQTISIITPNKKAVVLGLKDLSFEERTFIEKDINEYFRSIGDDDYWEFKYKKCNDEYQLLHFFFTQFVARIPLMSGWNFIDFDWKYLANRAKRLGLDVKLASPTHSTEKKYTRPTHVGIVDYMELFKKYDRSIAVKESLSLEFASTAVLGVGKIKYDGDLQRLYEDDFKTYVYYNAVDSILCHYIDNKLKLADILLVMSYICKIPVSKVDSPVAITESLLADKFAENNRVVAYEYQDRRGVDTHYEGAFVKEPQVNAYRGIAAYDYASLYPSIMMQFNISPDSYKYNLEPGTKVDDDSVIVTASGAVYDKKPSALKQVQSTLYAQRKEYKAMSYAYSQIANMIDDKLKTLN